MIILDFGSGNSCLNNWEYVKEMIDELVSIDNHEHEVVIKWQLFKQWGENIPLDREIFQCAYHYAKHRGYKTTASVFDFDSLMFLSMGNVPFIKIANNRKLDFMIDAINQVYKNRFNLPRIIRSLGDPELFNHSNINLCCISEYPAKKEDYEMIFSPEKLQFGISDHTEDFKLFWKYYPQFYEIHYKLDSTTGLDSGSFARTPSQLKEIL